eukprot:363074-Chlamydomonas_euryale.AAC.15
MRRLYGIEQKAGEGLRIFGDTNTGLECPWDLSGPRGWTATRHACDRSSMPFALTEDASYLLKVAPHAQRCPHRHAWPTPFRQSVHCREGGRLFKRLRAEPAMAGAAD